jgi:hypothetical protein
MESNLAIGGLLLLTLCVVGCKREDETPRILRVNDITPGTTMLGGRTLNTAVIGDTLTISGEGFSSVAADNTVSVQGIVAPVLTASATQLEAVVPTGVPFSYVSVVITRRGYQSAEHRISVRALPSPVITGIRPTQGRVGSVVTIYGRHLLETVESNHIMFTNANGQQGAVYIRPFVPRFASADSLHITVPAGAGTGRIELSARPAQDVTNSFFSIATPVFTVIP